MKTRPMTDAERKEIEQIEANAKARFDAALKKLGPAYSAKHPRLG